MKRFIEPLMLIMPSNGKMPAGGGILGDLIPLTFMVLLDQIVLGVRLSY
jgi:hypothetical protein